MGDEEKPETPQEQQTPQENEHEAGKPLSPKQLRQALDFAERANIAERTQPGLRRY